MQFNFWKQVRFDLCLAMLLAMYEIISPTSAVLAQDEPFDIVEWVALNNEEQSTDEALPPKKAAIGGEIGRRRGFTVEENAEHFGRPIGAGNAFFFENRIGGGGETGRYWIGVECREVSPELRSQLGLGARQGLVVVRISKDSAAEKAGLKQHDIVMMAGEKKLEHVPDLAKAVGDAEGKDITLKIIRSGKEQIIDITPAERPRDVVKFIARPGAGMFVAGIPGAGHPFELPENMTVTIQRTGKQPAKITVTRDDEKWEVTDEQLEKLPDDIRPIIKRTLGMGTWTIPLPGKPFEGVGGLPPMMRIEAVPEDDPGHRMRVKVFNPGEENPHGSPPHDHFRPRPVSPLPPPGDEPNAMPQTPGRKAGDISPEIMKRLEMMDRRLEQMHEEIRRMEKNQENKNN